MMLDRKFKMTLKTKMFLWFYSKIHDLSSGSFITVTTRNPNEACYEIRV